MPRPGAKAPKGASPAACDATDWCRALGRLLRTARLFGPYASQVRPLREHAVRELQELVEHHGTVTLHITPTEILWEGDVVLSAPPGDDSLEGAGWEGELPSLLHRDGVRAISFEVGLPREEAASFVQTLVTICTASLTHDDLLTLLWEKELKHVKVQAAPLEQSIALVPAPDVAVTGTDGDQGWIVRGAPLLAVGAHAEPASPAAPAETSGPRFDDWFVQGASASSAGQLWREMHFEEATEFQKFGDQVRAETNLDFAHQVEDFMSSVHELDPRVDMRDALAGSSITWLASAVQHCDWIEALNAHQALRTLDPDGTRSADALEAGLASLDAEAIAERLDESSPTEQARFFGVVVRIGRPALELLIGVLARAARPRMRAGATTALSYACADSPRDLARYVSDSRWQIARNVVFALGQIGGDDVVPLLALAARHVDTRVRRAAVHALGQSSPAKRLPSLLAQLDTLDRPLLNITLAMLARDNDPAIAHALIERITAVDFEARSDESKLALFGALADAADDCAVVALEQLIFKGGWFARRTSARTGAAHTLAKIGTPAALAVLEAGLSHRSEGVRATCAEALATRERK